MALLLQETTVPQIVPQSTSGQQRAILGYAKGREANTQDGPRIGAFHHIEEQEFSRYPDFSRILVKT